MVPPLKSKIVLGWGGGTPQFFSAAWRQQEVSGSPWCQFLMWRKCIMTVTHLCRPGLVCSTPHQCKSQGRCHSLYHTNRHIPAQWRFPLENCESSVFYHLESYRVVPRVGRNQLGNNTDEDWISAALMKAVIVKLDSNVMLTSLTWSFTHYQDVQQQQKYHSPSAGERAHNQAAEEERKCWFITQMGL